MTGDTTTLTASSKPLEAPGPGPGERSVRATGRGRAWLIVGSIVAIGMLVDLLAHERTTQTASFDGVDAIRVVNDSGRVRVTVDPEAEPGVVEVTARVSDGLRSTALDQAVDGTELTLSSSCPNFGGTWCSVDWDVVVAPGLALVTEADDGGVEVRGRFASIDVHSDNGNTRIDGEAPTVQASSENGGVTVRLAEPPDSVDARSENGDVEVIVPPVEEGYRVAADSDNGRVETLLRTDPTSPRSIVANSDNGDVLVRSTP
jgi:hypothetical protein